VAQQLLSALRAAHESGVVHRDVKPSNVMLGPNGRVRLTDFGIAQAADDPRLTITGSVIGSPGYLSPERLEGAEAAPASDLWALGLTLFYALHGVSLFDRETTAATISAVLHADIPPTRTRGPLGAVIAGLLQRAPQARLTGPQAAALLTSPGGTTTTVLPDSGPATAPLTPGVAPRRRRGWWIAAALVVGLVLGWAVGIGQARTTGPDVSTLTYGEGGDVPVFGVTSRACLPGQLAPGRAFPSGSVVSCDAPHDLEVFQTLDPFGTQFALPYPGTRQLSAYAGAACRLVFDSAVITGADKDRLDVTALVPSQTAFGIRSSSDSFAERDVICVLSSADGSQLTGSRVAEGAG
jgi:hypothetical protein